MFSFLSMIFNATRQVHLAGLRNILQDRNKLKCRSKPTRASFIVLISASIFAMNSWWLQQSERFWFIIFGALLLICLWRVFTDMKVRGWTLYPTQFLPSSCLLLSPWGALSRDLLFFYFYVWLLPSIILENERYLDKVKLLFLKRLKDVNM